MVQLDLSDLTDEQLRAECIRYGVKPGPITERTRNLWENKLKRLIKETNGDSVEVTPEVKKSSEVLHSTPSQHLAVGEKNGKAVERPATPEKSYTAIPPVSSTPPPPFVSPTPTGSLYPRLPQLQPEPEEFEDESSDDEDFDRPVAQEPLRRRNPPIISPRRAQPVDIYGVKQHHHQQQQRQVDAVVESSSVWKQLLFIVLLGAVGVYLYYEFVMEKSKSV